MERAITAYRFVRINKHNFGNKGWEKQEINRVGAETIFTDQTDHVALVQGPDNAMDPRLIRGVILLHLPTSVHPTLRRIRLRKGGYSGTLLSEIDELQYATYVEHSAGDAAPVLVFQVDSSNNKTHDFNCFFDPAIQYLFNSSYPVVQRNTWQEWDALNGTWQSDMVLPGLTNTRFTLQELLSLPQYSQASIIDTPGGGHDGPGIRFTVGGDTIYNDFKGYVDAFVIGTSDEQQPTLHDFLYTQ